MELARSERLTPKGRAEFLGRQQKPVGQWRSNMSAIDRAADLLFSVDRPTMNIRFLCGGDDNVLAERLAEQIVISETQIRNNHARRIDNVDEHLTTISS